MTRALRSRPLSLALAAAALAACSGSSSSSGPTVSLAVTDAASDDLSTFNIGLESVELLSATAAPVSLLQIPTAVDFAALTDLSRVLNVTSVPEDTYTGLEVTFDFGSQRVHVNGDSVQATLVDADDNALIGSQTFPIAFTVPLTVSSGNYVIELDLDLNQSADVDAGNNKVYFEPSIFPRVNRTDPKEHAIGGDLRTVVLASNLIRIGLEALPGDPTPVVEIHVGPGTVFQVNGQCLLGAAGLAAVDALAPNTWVQAFGSMNSGSNRFQASTIEAGTGSYNGGTDIVEGVIVGRTGGPGTDAVLTVEGHSSDAAHTSLLFNLSYTVNTSFANTKVVRRGSPTQFDTDDLNVGQHVRMFGMLTFSPNVLDCTTATDVVRMEPTWISGTANGAPTAGDLEIDLARVDLRDVGDFDWNVNGTIPPDADPSMFVIDEHNLGVGQGIVAGEPVVALGFFPAVDDANQDFVASVVANRDRLPSLLLIRDRLNGMTVMTTTTGASLDYTFSGAPTALEKATVDMGLAGQTDVTGPGVELVSKPGTLGLGIYLLRDRTLDTLSLYFTFTSFYQAVDAALMGGATLFNVGAVGRYDQPNGTFESALASVTVQ